jgi:hypothetical protein
MEYTFVIAPLPNRARAQGDRRVRVLTLQTLDALAAISGDHGFDVISASYKRLWP